MSDANLQLLILTLKARFGRQPTVSEVEDFIFGGAETRRAIWDLGKETNEATQEVEPPEEIRQSVSDPSQGS